MPATTLRVAAMNRRYLALTTLLLASAMTPLPTASAAALLVPAPEVTLIEDEATLTHVNLRAGASSSSESGRPVICMQVSAIAELSFETCGTGTGILHNDSTPEMAHFRMKWATNRWSIAQGLIELQACLGFTELQVGKDTPGFSFGSPTTAEPVETAGPEASLSLQWIYPLDLGLEFIGDATFGAAWFEHAPELVTPRDKLAPFGEISAGVGW